MKRNLFKSILVYTFRISKRRADEINTIIEKLPSTLKPTIMSMYDSIVEKGIEKGIQKGIEKGRLEEKIETVRKGFKKGMSIKDLAEWTDLPETKVTDIINQLKKSGVL